jgi:hypothetical protein
MSPTGPAVAAGAANDMTFPADQIAHDRFGYVRTDGDDLANELVPDREWHRHMPARPLIPAVDVKICAADSGT